MRKVTKEVCTAFINGETKTVGNTCTDGQHLWLHGNLIARKADDGTIDVTLAGWPSRTTRDRLNGLIDLLSWDSYEHRHRPADRFYQRDFVTHYDDQPVGDYDWITIGRADYIGFDYPF